jgi:hypothetical protein
MLANVKAFIKSVPVIGPSIAHLRRESFKNSASYWDHRYKTGGNSGAGSYSRLAEFKASVLNEFIRKHQITSVIEYGSGDGAQLKLAQYPRYTGVDISEKALEICRSMFRDDTSKRFLHSSAVNTSAVADLSLSLDVVYHLVEDSTFDAYMRQLFGSAERFVIVYSSNMEREWPFKHVRHRRFTDWVAQNKPEWYLQSTVENAYPWDAADPEHTSFADFYFFALR